MTDPVLTAPVHPPRHCPTGAARCADLTVHIIGLSLAVIFGLILVVLAGRSASAGLIAATAIYALGIIIMLACSTLYNFAPAPKRPKFHKFDHAGIFLMIAASYTPFTTQVLEGCWAISMTVAVWVLAGLGIVGKIFLGDLNDKIWVGFYVALGWIVVIAIVPLSNALNWQILALLAAGGVTYTIGTLFYMNRTLQFARAIWHGHVVTAAALHWVAILLGVTLVAA